MPQDDKKKLKPRKLETWADRVKRFRLVQPAGSSDSPTAAGRKNRVFPRLKRHGPNKVYVLKGYTTRERVTEKRKRERRIQRNINITMAIIFLILIIVLFYWLDPVGRFLELARMLGL